MASTPTASAARLDTMGSGSLVCERCYSVGTARKSTSGVGWLGAAAGLVLAWAGVMGNAPIGALVGVGLILLSAVAGTRTRCTGCGHTGFVPAGSPRGQQLVNSARDQAG